MAPQALHFSSCHDVLFSFFRDFDRLPTVNLLLFKSHLRLAPCGGSSRFRPASRCPGSCGRSDRIAKPKPGPDRSATRVMGSIGSILAEKKRV